MLAPITGLLEVHGAIREGSGEALDIGRLIGSQWSHRGDIYDLPGGESAFPEMVALVGGWCADIRSLRHWRHRFDYGHDRQQYYRGRRFLV